MQYVSLVAILFARYMQGLRRYGSSISNKGDGMDKDKKFLKGAAILGFAGLLCKLIGAVYRIPLNNIIGNEAMGIYSKAYPIYTFLLVLSTSGIPTAISKMVAERTAVGDYRGAQRTFATAFYLLLSIGLATTVLMLAGSPWIAAGLGIPDGAKTIIAIAPSLLLVSVLSAYRGYFQGMQQMTPTAISQLVEQLFKLGAGFALAILWMPKGPVYAAAGALLGISVSEAAALLLMLLTFQKARPGLNDMIRRSPRMRQEHASQLRKRLLQIAIPITIGGAIMPLVDMIDSILVTWVMKNIGYTLTQINDMYGVYKGMVNSIVVMPSVLTVALSMSLVPAISNNITKGNYPDVKKFSAAGIKLALLIGLPSCVGLYFMAYPILHLLYGAKEEASLLLGTNIMQTMSLAILFLSLVQATTGILQGLGKIMIPIRNLFIGVGVKLIVNYTLVSIPDINIKGAPVGTVACYGIAALLNIIAVVRHSGMSFRFSDLILRPFSAVLLMAASIYGLQHVLTGYATSGTRTLLIICVAVVVYGVALLLLGAFNQDDLDMMPGGGKLGRLLKKLRIPVKQTKEEDCSYVPPSDRHRDRLG